MATWEYGRHNRNVTDKLLVPLKKFLTEEGDFLKVLAFYNSGVGKAIGMVDSALKISKLHNYEDLAKRIEYIKNSLLARTNLLDRVNLSAARRAKIEINSQSMWLNISDWAKKTQAALTKTNLTANEKINLRGMLQEIEQMK